MRGLNKGIVISMLGAVLLFGCSPAMLTSLIGASGGKPLASVDTQIGKEANKQVIVGDQDRQEFEIDAKGNANITNETNKTDSKQDFSGPVDHVSVTNISPLYLGLLILGWILPTPAEMWRGIWKLRRKKRR